MTQLALIVIARDEAQTLARCLASARPFVGEMIVLDTGSSDDTARIATEGGARVATFAWCDDYAAARNAALALSGAEWNLVLDADEWIDAGQDAAGLLEHACAADSAIGVLPVGMEFELAGRTVTSTRWRERLLPAAVRYAGAVDEQPDSDLPRRRTALRILNDGMRRPERAAKRDGRTRLLLAALTAAPQDARLYYLAGRAAEEGGDFAGAAGYYQQALAGTAAEDGWRHDLVVRAMFTFKMAGLPEEAVHLADLEMDNCRQSPDYYFALGDVLLDMASRDPASAGGLLPMIEASWLRCMELGEQPMLEGAVSGRGSFLAAHNLAVFYEGQGDMERAQHFRTLVNSGG